MKCEYCYGTLSLEDEYCPHCGRPNKHAKQHIKDMKRYHGEFEDTKDYVYKKTGQYMGIAVRAAIIAGLLILDIVILILGGAAWRIHTDMVRAKANRNYEKNSRIMDEYLAEEDYLKLAGFCQAHNLRFYDSPYDEKYELVSQLCSRYSYVFDSLSRYITCRDEDSYEQVLDSIVDELDYFYKLCLNEDNYYTDIYGESELYGEVRDDLLNNVEQLLVTYVGLTLDEAESLPELRKTQMALLLDEKLQGRMQNE